MDKYQTAAIIGHWRNARIATENIGAGQVQEWNAETFIEKINASKPALEAPVMNPEFEDEEDLNF
ncbi:MAG TPA: hypothetical protein VIM07_15045 [Chitinophagaceae bacterium]